MRNEMDCMLFFLIFKSTDLITLRKVLLIDFYSQNNDFKILDRKIVGPTMREHPRKKVCSGGQRKSDTMGEVSVERLRHLHDSVGFSVGDIRPLQKRPHVYHANCMIALEPTFAVLASTDIGKGSLKAIAIATRIPSRTVKDWRRHLLADWSWRPCQHHNEHRRALTDEQEAEVLQEIRVQYLDRGLYSPPKVAQIMAKRIWAGRPEDIPVRRGAGSGSEGQITEEKDGTEELDEPAEPEHSA
jgi:hypothetical protein